MNSTLPTGENLVYGDATVTSARRHLSPYQFPARVPTPSIDGGWLGPLGSYGDQPSHAPLYGFGTNDRHPGNSIPN